MSSFDVTIDSSQARALLTLDFTGVGSATVYRNDPDGSRSPVRDAEPVVMDGPVALVDDECPLDEVIDWIAIDTTDFTNTLASSPVTIPSTDRIWLKHPGKPALNINLVPAEPPERHYAMAAATLTAMGRRHPIVITDGRRKAATSSLSLRTSTLAEAAALRAILDDGTPLLLQAPAGFDLGSVWIQPLDLSEKWIVRYLPNTRRLWALEFAIVDRPAGMSMVSIAGSWQYWQAQFSSWDEMRDQYPTWQEAQNAL